MNMNRDELSQPEVLETSKLPLATIGSQAPLVIDLPDGQKLVVGNLDPGTVIEIATWRGTGRPDSRTNRLMLGVSASEEEIPVTGKDKSRDSDGVEVSKLALAPLDQVTEGEAIHANKNSMQYSVSTSNTVSEQINRTGSLKKRLKFGILGKFAVAALLCFIILLGLIGPGNLRIAHPASGVSSSLGSAKDSLFIVQANSMGKVGEPVIVNIPGEKESPVLAIVSAIDGDNYLLATNTNQFQSKTGMIHGKVLFVVPFLGAIAHLFGK